MDAEIKTKEVDISIDNHLKLEKNRILLVSKTNYRDSKPPKRVSGCLCNMLQRPKKLCSRNGRNYNRTPT